MRLRIKKILIFLEVVQCASKPSLARIEKRGLHRDAIGQGHCSIVIDLACHEDSAEVGHPNSEFPPQDCELVHQSLATLPAQGDEETQQIRQFPRRKVDYDKFERIKYSPRPSTSVTVDMAEYTRVTRRGDVEESRWGKRKLGKISNWVKRPSTLMAGWNRLPSQEIIEFKRKPDESCTVCSVEYKDEEPGSPLLLFPGCNHLFHEHCLTTWLETSPEIESLVEHSQKCPSCRLPAPTKGHLRFLCAVSIYYLIKYHLTILQQKAYIGTCIALAIFNIYMFRLALGRK